MAVFGIALILGVWAGWIRKVVAVRPARSEDHVYERYLGISHDNASVRNIAVVKGTFTRNTWLNVRLIAVHSGQCQTVNALTVGRTPHEVGSLPWRTMKITLALGEWDTADARVIQVGSAGQTRGGGSAGEYPVDITTSFAETFTGSIWPGRECIIHAEGDTKIEMNGAMTVQDFTQRHTGNYLVVTAQLQ